MLRLLLILLWTGVSAVALAQEDPLRPALAGWGCEPLQVLELGDRWYVACGTQGVFVVERRDGNLVLAERRRGPGSARALYTRDGLVWVESTRLEARPMIDLAVEGAPAPSAPPPLAVPAPPVVRPPPALPPPILTPVAPRQESKLFPSRKGGHVALEAGLRPLLPLDTRGLALIGEVAVSYYGQRDWFVQLRGFPLGAMIVEGPDTPLMGALAQGGYDHPFFAIGLGVGALTRGGFLDWDFDRNVALNARVQSTRFAFSQYARLGALDGLHLSLHSVFVLLDEWKFGFIEVRGQIPLTRGCWLVPAGAGGAQAGFYYGEVGLRLLLRGDRSHGSLFVRPSAGIAGVDQRIEWSSVRVGPMVGIHLEWRL